MAERPEDEAKPFIDDEVHHAKAQEFRELYQRVGGKPLRVSVVDIQGNTRTKQGILQRELGGVR